MANFDEQTVAALTCVTLAIIAMGRWSLRWWRGQSVGGCGACAGGCSAASKPEPVRLKVTLPIIDAAELK